MKRVKLFVLCPLLVALSACTFTSPYRPPGDNEPNALLKLKYKYSEVVPGTTIGARMNIRHGAKSGNETYQSAFNKSYDIVNDKKNSPDIPMTAVNVHPGEKTDINMAVYFYWYTTHSYTIMVNNAPQLQTQQVYNERACTASISFTPEAGNVYILDYSSPNVDKDCRTNAYRQIKQSNGQFKMVKVAASKIGSATKTQ